MARTNIWRRLAVQQMQEMAADRIVVGLHVDPLAVVRVVEPVEQRGAETSHQPIDDIACAGLVVVVLLRQHAAKRRDRGAHHVHRMRRGGQCFQRALHATRAGRATRSAWPCSGELGGGRQRAVHQEIGDLLELALLGDVEDVVAAIVQIVAGAPDSAQRGVAGGDAGQADAFLCAVGEWRLYCS